MEREGYLSQMDYATPVREGDLYGLLFGDIVALGYDAMEGTSRSLTDEEVARVSEYFTSESGPGLRPCRGRRGPVRQSRWRPGQGVPPGAHPHGRAGGL